DYYLFPIPRPTRPIRCRALWRTAEGKTFRDTFMLNPARPVHVHTVFDFQWTTNPETAANPRNEHKAMIERLLDCFQTADALTDGPRMVITIPFYHLESVLTDAKVPMSLKERLATYICAGRLTWNLIPNIGENEWASAEDQFQILYHARFLAGSFDRPVPQAATLGEMSTVSASLGMAVTAAGGAFILMGGDQEALPLRVPPLFWWKLPDESRVLVHYRAGSEESLLPPADWPWDHWLSVKSIEGSSVSDTQLPLSTIGWIGNHFDFPKYHLGTLDDYADVMRRRHGTQIPSIEGDFIATYEDSPTDKPSEAAEERSQRERETVADMLRTLEGELSRVFAQPRQWVDLSNVCHRLIDSKENEILDTGWYRISATRKARPTTRTGKHVILFNALSWPRSGLVRIPEKQLPSKAFALIDPTTKGSVLYERRSGYIEFIAPPVPACGYLALEIRETAGREQPGLFADWQESTQTLHTTNQSLMFHKAGGLARWHDRARSYQWCSDQAKYPLGSFLYERPNRERLRNYVRAAYRRCPTELVNYFEEPYEHQPAGHEITALGATRITTEVGPFSAQVIVETNGSARPTTKPFACRTRFTLYRGRPELYVNLNLSAGPRAQGPEGGYAFFPFAGEEPCVLANRVLHTFQPSEYLAGRSNAARLFVHHGLRMEYIHAGVNFFPLHTAMLGLDGPAAWRFDPKGNYKTGHVYAALLTTKPGMAAVTGQWSYDFVLQPTGNDNWDGGLARGGAELFRPLLASVVGDFKGRSSQSLLNIHPDKVQLLSLQPATFAPGLMLRLWNSDVEPVTARLSLPVLRRGQELYSCDLMERTLRKIKVNKEGVAAVTLVPQQLLTLLLTEHRSGNENSKD
ncbi:MAG: hypothetical protein GXY44_06535, partial [Phycisphaerales bacterium]|nr:hypothetical protein [Phycisphaerales bacterium]